MEDDVLQRIGNSQENKKSTKKTRNCYEISSSWKTSNGHLSVAVIRLSDSLFSLLVESYLQLVRMWLLAAFTISVEIGSVSTPGCRHSTRVPDKLRFYW